MNLTKRVRLIRLLPDNEKKTENISGLAGIINLLIVDLRVKIQPILLTQGEITMGETGKKDKGRKEQRKKPKLNIKEKRKLKQEKKNETPGTLSRP